jgi:DNA-binding IclR family transcriptional regulator
MSAIKTRTVPAVYKALNILELLRDSRAGLTLPELVEESNLAKSSVHYLLVTLERCGYVDRGERSGRYMLGAKLFSMANSAGGNLSLRQRTAPYLSGLRMRTGLTVHLAILEQNEAVLIDRQETSRGSHLASWVGKRMDLHCTAIGKAILAFLPDAEIDAIILKHGLARHNDNTISTSRRLREELDRVVKKGYALDNEEDELGVRCLGVPIFGRDNRPIAAISIAGTTSEISIEDIPRLSNELRQTATAICQKVIESMRVITFSRAIHGVAS